MIQQSDEAIRDMEIRARRESEDAGEHKNRYFAHAVLETILWLQGEGDPPLDTEYETAPEPFLPED